MNAFAGDTSLRYLTVPSNVTSFEMSAMYSVTLTRLICLPTTPPTLKARSLATCDAIYVPAESVDLYKIAATWSNQASKIHSIEELPQ